MSSKKDIIKKLRQEISDLLSDADNYKLHIRRLEKRHDAMKEKLIADSRTYVRWKEVRQRHFANILSEELLWLELIDDPTTKIARLNKMNRV